MQPSYSSLPLSFLLLLISFWSLSMPIPCSFPVSHYMFFFPLCISIYLHSILCTLCFSLHVFLPSLYLSSYSQSPAVSILQSNPATQPSISVLGFFFLTVLDSFLLLIIISAHIDNPWLTCVLQSFLLPFLHLLII